jgi:hypothetical protein
LVGGAVAAGVREGEKLGKKEGPVLFAGEKVGKPVVEDAGGIFGLKEGNVVLWPAGRKAGNSVLGCGGSGLGCSVTSSGGSGVTKACDSVENT